MSTEAYPLHDLRAWAEALAPAGSVQARQVLALFARVEELNALVISQGVANTPDNATSDAITKATLGPTTVDIYDCQSCPAQWAAGELGRTKTCPDCGGHCTFSEHREENSHES